MCAVCLGLQAHTPLGKNGHTHARPNQAAPQSGFCSLALQDTLEKDVCFYLSEFLYLYNFPYNLSSSPPKYIVENKKSFFPHFLFFCFFKMKSLFVTKKNSKKSVTYTHTNRQTDRQTHGLMVCKLY